MVITLLNQVSTRNKETATSGPRDAAARGNSQQHLPGNSELLMEKELKPKGRRDAPAGKTFHSLNFTNHMGRAADWKWWQHPAPAGARISSRILRQEQGLPGARAPKSPSPAPSGPNPTCTGGCSLKYSRKETQSTLQPESKQK